ncbi:CBS domain-containing protein [Catenulispora sp. MAP12-49]|uniref:CBS domain-containing protein n=1 Tax=unclassified Catenulispora TaxID=414885 RepID=UPI0035159023
MATTISEIMTTPVQCVDGDQPLEEVARLMRDKGVGAVPVRGADGELTGMLTDRDIAVRGVAEGMDLSRVAASTLASKPPVCVRASDPVLAAQRAMADHRIRRVPVVDGPHLVGIVSQSDLARVLPPGISGLVEHAIVQDI